MTIGRNTQSGQLLTSFVERVERIRKDRKQATADEAAVLAEAKSAGFIPKAIKELVKRRGMKPHDLQESKSIMDTYEHALGMASDTPLFRAVGLMVVDTASRDEVIESLKRFVPDNGSITVEAGGKPVKLTRDKSGEVRVEDVVPPAPAPVAAGEGSRVRAEDPPPPDVDDATAEALGRQAFRENTPIVSNPFPFGDPRRARWESGWCAEGGNDGMGPDD